MRARRGRRTAEPSCKLAAAAKALGRLAEGLEDVVCEAQDTRATTSPTRRRCLGHDCTADAGAELSAVRDCAQRHPPAIGERQARCRQVEPPDGVHDRDERVDRSELA